MNIDSRVRKAARYLLIYTLSGPLPAPAYGGHASVLLWVERLFAIPKFFSSTSHYPTSNAKLRVQMRAEIKELQRRFAQPP